jgi:hypothetical protein
LADDEVEKAMSEYKDRYVAFLDLLGFKAQVAIAEANVEVRTILHEVLKQVRDTIGGNSNIGLRFNYFSDCLVLTADRSPLGLWEMFGSIFTLTTNLMQFDVLVRGGLTGGGAYHGKDFLYGTAINRAVTLESKCAVNPLTLVSQEVYDDAARLGEPYLKWLREDGPQRYFVDYLRWYADYRPERILGTVVADDPGKRVMDYVIGRLEMDTGRAREKAVWMQNYWNETVAPNGIFGKIEPGVTPRYKSRGPTIMIRRMAGPARPAPNSQT